MAFENGFSLKSELADAGTKFGQLFGLNDIGKLLDRIEMSDTIGGLIDGIKLPDDTKEPEQTQELTPEEINEKQRAAIAEAEKRQARGEVLSDVEKGNLGEMRMDQYFISKGYTPLHRERVTDLNDKGHHGLDGVYEKDGHYIIADAKYGTAQLNPHTKDGPQMSRSWIEARLDASVGKEKADEIRDAWEDDPSSVETEVYHYNPEPNANGETYSDIYHVNEAGEKVGSAEIVECHKDGERIDLKNGG